MSAHQIAVNQRAELLRHRRVCFARAHSVTPGYNSILSVGYMTGETTECELVPYLHDFAAHWLTSFGLPLQAPVPFKQVFADIIS